MENYIVINGKKAELTEEQLKKLGIEPKRKTPFDRVKKGGRYCFVNIWSNTISIEDAGGKGDQSLFEAFNYFNDEAFAKQVALHELLNRKLLKYAWDNNAEDCEWDGQNSHWHIEKLIATNGTVFSAVEDEHYKCCTPYFSKREIVEQAIEDVVEPFMAEHPEFVW